MVQNVHSKSLGYKVCWGPKCNKGPDP